MQRILTLQIICDDDELESRLTPPTIRVNALFEPRQQLAAHQSLTSTIAKVIDNFLTGTIGPHETNLYLTEEQAREQAAEQLALDATREPLVRLK